MPTARPASRPTQSADATLTRPTAKPTRSSKDKCDPSLQGECCADPPSNLSNEQFDAWQRKCKKCLVCAISLKYCRLCAQNIE